MIQDTGPASLSRLNDVVLPPEVSLWPSAPGWPLVGTALLFVLIVLAVLLVRRHRALRYRREALAVIRELRTAREPAALPDLLKRVALCAYARADVAALSGARWTRFLDQTGGAGRFGKGLGDTLKDLAYGGTAGAAPEELYDAAEAWIRAQGPAR